MNWVAELAVPPGVTTQTVAPPAASGGEVAVISVPETTEKAAAIEPNFTLVAPARLMPLICTEVPPAVGPEAGLMLPIAGLPGVK